MSTQKSPNVIDRHGVKLTMIALFIAFAIPSFFGYKLLRKVDHLNHQNQDNIVRIERERQDRISTQQAINAYFCRSNNHQNGVLSGLLIYVLAASPPDNRLTERQRQGKEVFEQALAKLHRTNCGKLRIGSIRPAPLHHRK